MHYNKDSEKLYISLFYPKTESKKLNTIINDYYKEYLDNQKASKNSKDIIYMDYSIDKVFDQYLNLSFTALSTASLKAVSIASMLLIHVSAFS